MYYQPDLIRRWTLDRGSSTTYHRSGGNQPAHQSMINRRFMIVPPALASGGHTEQLEGQPRNLCGEHKITSMVAAAAPIARSMKRPVRAFHRIPGQ
jgi:hypothetical protein